MRDVPVRHRNMRAVFEYSWGLLSLQERKLFAQLSVFRGGFTREATVKVSDADELLLMALVQKSLIKHSALGHYELSEPARQFADEKLKEKADIFERAHEQHAEYYSAYVQEKETLVGGPKQQETLTQIHREIENVREALHWAFSKSHIDRSLKIVNALGRFWEIRGYWSEGVTTLKRALAIKGQAPVEARTQALRWAANLERLLGNYPTAKELAEESLALSRAAGDRRGVTAALNHLGMIVRAQGDYPASRTFYQESVSVWRELGDKPGLASTLNNLGNLEYTQGDYEAAYKYHSESLALKREVGDKWAIAISLNNLGNVANYQGDYPSARRFYEESLSLHRELQDKRGISATLHNIGVVANEQADFAAARVYFEESLAIRRELDDKSGIAASLSNLGIVAHHQGDYISARIFHEQSLSLNHELGNKRLTLIALTGIASAASRSGDYAEARKYFEESLVMCRDINDKRSAARNLLGLALLAEIEGKTTWAVRLTGAAEAIRDTIGAPISPVDKHEYEQQVTELPSP